MCISLKVAEGWEPLSTFLLGRKTGGFGDRQTDRQTWVQVQLLHSVAGGVFKSSTLQGTQHESPQEAVEGLSGYWGPLPLYLWAALSCPRDMMLELSLYRTKVGSKFCKRLPGAIGAF